MKAILTEEYGPPEVLKEDTVLSWIKAAAEHAAAIEEVLLANYRLERGQLDALWSYVGNKGEKKLP